MPKEKQSPKLSQAAITKSPKRTRKIHPAVWIVGSAALLGGGGYALWHFVLRKDDQTEIKYQPDPAAKPIPPISSPPRPTSTPRTLSGNTDTTFPLRQGMKGQRVKVLQKGLNKGGAGLVEDGDWGPKTQSALRKANVQTPISAQGFASILAHMGAGDPYGATSGQSAGGRGASTLTSENDQWNEAKRLGGKVAANYGQGVLAILKSWPSASVYKAVSAKYVQLRFPRHAPRKTVVNALVGNESPFSPSEKNNFRKEFIRMGLLYNSSRDSWSLPSGLAGIAYNAPLTYGRQAVTIHNTAAYDSAGRVFELPMGMLVGSVIDQDGDFTQILTGTGQVVMVNSQSIATT